jgi:hypothetical protein
MFMTRSVPISILATSRSVKSEARTIVFQMAKDFVCTATPKMLFVYERQCPAVTTINKVAVSVETLQQMALRLEAVLGVPMPDEQYFNTFLENKCLPSLDRSSTKTLSTPRPTSSHQY